MKKNDSLRNWAQESIRKLEVNPSFGPQGLKICTPILENWWSRLQTQSPRWLFATKWLTLFKSWILVLWTDMLHFQICIELYIHDPGMMKSSSNQIYSYHVPFTWSSRDVHTWKMFSKFFCKSYASIFSTSLEHEWNMNHVEWNMSGTWFMFLHITKSCCFAKHVPWFSEHDWDMNSKCWEHKWKMNRACYMHTPHCRARGQGSG